MDWKDKLEIVAAKFPHRGIMVHHRVLPAPQADFAMKLAIHCGMVAGVEDGEDSTGRARGRRLNAEEVANYACDVAEAMFDRFERDGLMLAVPSLEELRRKDNGSPED